MPQSRRKKASPFLPVAAKLHAPRRAAGPVGKSTLASLRRRFSSPVPLRPIALVSTAKASKAVARALGDRRISIFAPARVVLTPDNASPEPNVGLVFYQADVVSPVDPARLPSALAGLFGGYGAPFVKLNGPFQAGQRSGGALAFVNTQTPALAVMTFSVHTFGPTRFDKFTNGQKETTLVATAGAHQLSLVADLGSAGFSFGELNADVGWVFISCTIDFIPS